MSEVVQSRRLSEAVLVQNEALGAYALWRFGLGYQDRDGHAAALPLAFLVLPLILHGPTLAMVLGTHKASGLHLFAGKLGDKREDLLAIHGRTLALRRLTLESLVRAEQSGLIRIEPTMATIWSISPYEDLGMPALPERIRQFGPACERIGYWFAGLTDQQVVHTLRVEF
ncbi:three component ABC system middle component [Aquitalea sp.]|uniref:three component ABC system middle component n=1 Tax=Aquitalea sp. TaxID=1872623 RepID=UPI00258294DA|nr:three component ABC system middle component [Aquitalea sp.]